MSILFRGRHASNIIIALGVHPSHRLLKHKKVYNHKHFFLHFMNLKYNEKFSQLRIIFKRTSVTLLTPIATQAYSCNASKKKDYLYRAIALELTIIAPANARFHLCLCLQHSRHPQQVDLFPQYFTVIPHSNAYSLVRS